jgi:hypothetical protein
MYYCILENIMATRTVRFDEEAEKTLAQIRKTTGLSISAVLKQGLLAYQEKITHTTAATPYEIYQALDLGPGGYALAPSTETRQGMRMALAKKLKG